jgi:hypothetical protein
VSDFTPGPWNIHYAYPLDTPVACVTDGSFTYWIGRVAQNEKLIADVTMISDHANMGWKHVADVAEARANTHLISAAPELYEALKRARGLLANGLLAGGFLVEQSPWFQLVGAIDAVLSKAEGKSL